MPHFTDVGLSRIAIVDHGLLFIECKAKNFDVVGQRNVTTSDVDGGEVGIAEGLLTGVKMASDLS